MEHSEHNLESLKEDYAIFEKKYGLPNFKDLNEEFEIEHLTEIETDFLLRIIRKTILEKITFFSKFIGMIINPGEGGSLFSFSVAKTLNQENRKELAKLYGEISKLQLESLKRDISYSEKEEAGFIKHLFSFWEEETKKTLLETLKIIESNWENESKKSEKSYFM
jgi:hypothetical protein